MAEQSCKCLDGVCRLHQSIFSTVLYLAILPYLVLFWLSGPCTELGLQWASRPHLAPCGWAGTLSPHIRPHTEQSCCFEHPPANVPRCQCYEAGEGLPQWHVPRPGGSDRFRGCCGRRWTKGWPFGGCVWHVTCSSAVEWWHPLFNEHCPMLEWACLPQRVVNLPAIAAAPLIQEVLSNGSNKEG